MTDLIIAKKREGEINEREKERNLERDKLIIK